MRLELYMCDVLAERPLTGNNLGIVLHDEPLTPQLMQALTRELRQFETDFLRPTSETQRHRPAKRTSEPNVMQA